LGDRILLLAATLNASGLEGGGTIRVGGDYRGQGHLPNALETTVSQDSTIRADALQQGDGGQIIVWADDTAHVHGTLTARGGAVSGNGGLIETSGRRSLNLTSIPDASAANGVGGLWLIDPTNISLVAGGGGAIGTNAVDVANINAALNAGTSVLITTDIGGIEAGNITQDAPIDKTAGTLATLTLEAANNIVLNSTITSTVGGLNLVLNADSDGSGNGNVTINAPIATGGGNITVNGTSTTGTGILSFSTIDSGGGNLLFNGSSNVPTVGTFLRGIEIQGDGITSGGGDITFNGSSTNESAILVFSPIASNGGEITFNGVGTGTFGTVRGVEIQNIVTSDGGNINLLGVGVNEEGIRLDGTLDAGTGNIVLAADRLNLATGFGEPGIAGSGTLLIQPVTPELSFTVGGAGDPSTTFLNETELGIFTNGFSAITIGRDDSSGVLTLGGNVTFNDPVILRSPTGNGAINTSGFTLTGGDNATLTLLANQNITTGAIANPGRNITLTSTAGTINTTGGILDTSLIPETVNPGVISGVGGNITLSAANLVLGDLSTLVRSGNFENAGDVSLTTTNGNISVGNINTQALSYFGFIANGGDVIMTATNGNITVNGTILTNATAVGAIDTAENSGAVRLSAPTGTITLANTISTSAVGFGASTVTGNGGEITVDAATINLDAALIESGGTIIGDGATVGLGGAIAFIGNTILSQPTTTLNSESASGSGSITFSNSVNGTTAGNNALILNAGNAEVTFDAALGNNTALGNLRINSTGTTRLNRNVVAVSLTTNAGGTTQISGTITTTGNAGQIYNDPVTLLDDVALIGDELDFNSTVSGSGVLRLQPFSENRAIALGLSTDSGTNSLDLLSSDLNALQDGFSSILIGTTNGTGTITLAHALSFNDPVTLLGGSTLITPNRNIVWNLTSAQGGDLNSLFPNGLQFNNIEILQAGTGNDTFVFANGVQFGGTIQAGSGTDQFDYANFTDNVTVNLADLATSGIESVVGTTAASSTLIATNTVNNWTLTGSDTGTVNNIGFSSFQTLVGGTSDDRFVVNDGVTVTNLIEGGSGRLFISGNTFTLSGDLSANGDIIVQATQDLRTGNIITEGFNLQLTSDRGSIDTTAGTLNTSSANRNGGAIALNAFGNITTQDLLASGVNGGTITLNSATGIVSTGNLITTGTVNGGNITVRAEEAITTREIRSNGSSGRGGNVLLDPSGDIQVALIDAQGGTFGGNVDIFTDRFFRATDQFSDRTGTSASISTTGGTSGGNIFIRYRSIDQTPFVVGTATSNGTVGAITSGNYTIPAGSSFTQNYRLGNITLFNGIIPPNDNNGNGNNGNGNNGNGNGNNGNGNNNNPPDDEPQQRTDRNRSSDDVLTSAIDEPPPPPPQVIQVATLDEARSNLLKIQAQINVNTALVYIRFSPANLSEDLDFASAESNSTQQFADYFGRAVATQGIRIVRQPRGSDRLEIMVITGHGDPIIHEMTNVTRAQVKDVAERFQRQVTDVRRTNSNVYLTSAQQLHQWFITPIEADLQAQNIQTLAFVLDNGLRSVPIAALHDGNQFLVEKYSLGLLPSISLTDTSYVDIRGVQVLAMGASEFQTLPALPAVPIELNTIANDLWEGRVFLNQAFTLANLKAERWARPFGIVHLATHGEFRPGKPENSYIQFYDQRIGLDQLQDLGLNDPPVELLVLSACRTALGDDQAELGFAGLAVQAGVKSALASLWYVSDEGTLGFMTEFYRQLQDTPIKAEALRQTQLAMLRGEVRLEAGELRGSRGTISLPETFTQGSDRNLSHPFYWSAFTLVGSPW
jgi:CHAT domain-containing protein